MYISTDILLYYVISMIIVTGIQIYVVPLFVFVVYNIQCWSLYGSAQSCDCSKLQYTLTNFQSSLLLMFSTMSCVHAFPAIMHVWRNGACMQQVCFRFRVGITEIKRRALAA